MAFLYSEIYLLSFNWERFVGGTFEINEIKDVACNLCGLVLAYEKPVYV